MREQVDKSGYFYPRSNYYGGLTVEYLAHNANLQELSQKIAYICALEKDKEISGEQAYQEVKRLWTQFKQNQKELGIGVSVSTDE